MSSLRALVLDYGQVLSLPQPQDAVPAMARLSRAPADGFRTAYWAHRSAYDLGLPAADYWRRVLADVGASADAALVDGLIRRDVDSWTVYRDDVWNLAAAAHLVGLRTAILSNGVPEVMARVEVERPIAAVFDATIVSWEVGCAKPDAAIYRLTLEQLGVAAEASLFVDDRAENIDAARRLGFLTLHFDEAAGVAALRRLLP